MHEGGEFQSLRLEVSRRSTHDVEACINMQHLARHPAGEITQ